jgi:GDP-L-fucose synthase
MNPMFKNKRVLVAGGTGLIGRPLVDLLVAEGARVRVASLDDPSRAHPEAEFVRVDLTRLENCLQVCRGVDYVFNLLGVKGSPRVTRTKPASFFVPMVCWTRT